MTSCHDASGGLADARTGLAADPSAPSVVLVGNPNVGKSTLFNALTGARQQVTNAPGTTVEVQLGTWRGLVGTASGAGADEPAAVRVLDLPGTYSLLARSPDERVTAETVAGRGALGVPDLAVVLVEAGALSRSLYLLAQVAGAGQALVVALTMTDVAATRGVHVDPEQLATLLGVPVVPIDPRTGTGLDRLTRVVSDALTAGVPPVLLPDAAPACACNGDAACEPGCACDGPVDVDLDLDAELASADRLFTWVDGVQRALAGREVTGASGAVPGVPSPARPAPVRTWSDRVDRVLLDPWFGVPVFLAVMWALFQLATAAAAPLMAAVSSLVGGPVAESVRNLLPGPAWVEGFVVDGVLAGVGTVLSFAPLMGIMFLAIAVLEDSGYLARAAFVADRAMRAIGLDGRAMLPLVVGFGCNLPALAATRTLPNARQRLLTGLLVPYTSCAARLTVYILLASVFFPAHAGTAIFLMYVASITLVVAGGLVLRATAFRDLRREPFVLALPAYQRPRVRALLLSAWVRVRMFVTDAGKIIVITLAVVWVLMAVPVTGGHQIADVPVADSLYGRAALAISPVFAPAGFDDWHASAALLTGFVAKEVVVGSFAQSYAVDAPTDAAVAGDLGSRLRTTFESSSGGHAGAAAAAFMVFVLAYTPCLATVAEQRRLFGSSWTLSALGVQLAIAWTAAVVVFQLGRLM
ncbi:MAG TPA: ferrous iron transport protein B [Demequina sp.]|nr:ferrous iron transport protein B [Demequina sp.]